MTDNLFKRIIPYVLCIILGFIIGYGFAPDKPLYEHEPEMTTVEAIETWQREKWAENWIYWRAEFNIQFEDFLKSKLKRDNK